MRLRFMLLPLMLVTAAAASQARAEDTALWGCPGTRVTVRSSHFGEAQRVCAAALAPIAFLGRCGFHQKRDVTITAADDVYLLSAVKTVGDYLPGTGRVRVMSNAGFARYRPAAIAQVQVPVADLYSSVVAHEIAHAIFHDATEHLDLPRTAHEYVAYAVQVSTLPESVRSAAERSESKAAGSNLFAFSHFLLMADPERFGLIAWEHFNRPENGCAFLRNVVERKVHFPPPSD